MAATPPPRSGTGSGKDAWAAFATDELDLDIDPDLSAGEIRQLVDEHLEPPPDPDDEPDGAPAAPLSDQVTVAGDCVVSYHGQVVRLAAGATVSGGLARHLAATSASILTDG